MYKLKYICIIKKAYKGSKIFHRCLHVITGVPVNIFNICEFTSSNRQEIMFPRAKLKHNHSKTDLVTLHNIVTKESNDNKRHHQMI